MQFLLVDVASTLVFLFGYLTVVMLQRRRALAVPRGASRTLSREPRPVPAPGAAETGKQAPAAGRPRREWPRLSYPR